MICPDFALKSLLVVMCCVQLVACSGSGAYAPNPDAEMVQKDVVVGEKFVFEISDPVVKTVSVIVESKDDTGFSAEEGTYYLYTDVTGYYTTRSGFEVFKKNITSVVLLPALLYCSVFNKGCEMR